MCIGKNFALARLFILTVSALKEFEIKPVPGNEDVFDAMSLNYGLVLTADHNPIVFKAIK